MTLVLSLMQRGKGHVEWAIDLTPLEKVAVRSDQDECERDSTEQTDKLSSQAHPAGIIDLLTSPYVVRQNMRI